MKVQLEINAEEIMAQVLLEDYKGILADLRKLKLKDSLRSFEVEDMVDYMELKTTFERLIKYYHPIREAEKIIEELNEKG